MRAIAAVLLFAGWAAGQARTIAAAKIAGGDGKHLATGTITFTPTAPFQAADGTWVEQVDLVVKVVNGAFSVALEPNVNGTQYLAKWQLDGAKPRTDHWAVPAGTGTLKPGDVMATPAVPAVTIPLSQLAQSGAQIGQAPLWNGADWAPGNVGGGAGFTVNAVPCSSSPTFDFSLGTVQYIALTCDVTSSATANIPLLTPVMIAICQAAGTVHQFAWPAAASSGVTAPTMAGKCSAQWFVSPDGIRLISQGIGVINQ